MYTDANSLVVCLRTRGRKTFTEVSTQIHDGLINRGFEGGIETAQDFRCHILECLRWQCIDMARDLGIVIYIYADVQELAKRYSWGINAHDVINVYEYLQRHRGFPGNPYADWQRVRNMRMNPRWRYRVICLVSCIIQRTQNALEESLLPLHKQLKTSK